MGQAVSDGTDAGRRGGGIQSVWRVRFDPALSSENVQTGFLSTGGLRVSFP